MVYSHDSFTELQRIQAILLHPCSTMRNAADGTLTLPGVATCLLLLPPYMEGWMGVAAAFMCRGD
jgi:hypothetical protein